VATSVKTAEVKQLLRAHLLADSALAALVGGRVYGVHLEDADAQTVLQNGPMVVFEMLAGSLRWHGAVAIPTVEVYGYSKRSSDEASQVYDAVVDALQHERLTIGSLDVRGLARETQRPLDGYNTQIRAWFNRGRWAIEVA
jgi:hypothetical protein